ncbi:putative transporter C11D3.18C [Pseudocercospora fuligena]|uniref:Putative transporter C11D3.18C n=1 Tax=Pseudocercospora fuligena TaxID=685502 RepID=A0A8H6RP95_9PEZI|nr:putative transporter C11D3.18C [Pseudocercospora fuligena]
MSLKQESLDKNVSVDVDAAASELTIDPAAEKKLVRKLDLWLSPMMVLVFLVSYLDRSNIGNAAIAGMNEDLHLDGNKLNVAVTVFYVTYITFEIPSSLILKKARPSRLIPAFILLWSFVVVGSAFMKNYATLLASRLLLGAFESGLFPCLTLYLSTFYKPIEQAQRVSYLFVASALSGAFGGLLAYGLTRLNGVLEGWRWLFLVGGLISVAVGLGCLLLLPDTFEKAWWLNENDKKLMRIRHSLNTIYQGESEVFDREEVMLAFKDPKVWLSSFCQFCANTCSFGFSTFLPTIIKGFGFSAVRTQLLTVPVYIWASIFYLTIAWLSDYARRRAFFMVPLALVTAVGYCMMLGVELSNTAVLYFATFVTATGIYCCVGLNVTWNSNSNAGYYKRATAIGLQQTVGNSAGIMAGQIYRITNGDGRFVIGHAVSLATICCAAMGYAGIYLTLRRLNRKRENLSEEERTSLIDQGVKGDRHPDFRYTL